MPTGTAPASRSSAPASSSADRLALFGGTPVAPVPGLAMPAWPPADDATARRLAEVYLGRQWSFNGPEEQAFAREFAAYHGAKHGIVMTNGTVTLQSALAAHGIGRGDEVIVPALTWMATALAAAYLGAVPVFADIEPDTLCLDPAAVERALTPRTKAIIPVHLYGSMADLDAILALARKHDLVVIEDCAHGHGGKWNGRGLGSWGAVGSFSFQQSKTVASGEGGICLTSDDVLAEKLYRLKHIGYAAGTAQGKADAGPPPGLVCHNFRGTEFQAVVLRGQMAGLPALIDTYNANARRLEARLADVGVRVQARGRRSGPQNYYGFVMLFDTGPLASVPIDRIYEAARAEGLALGGTYGPVYRHMLFNLAPAEYRLPKGGCPVADGAARDRAGVFLHPWLGADAATIDAIGEIIAKLARNADTLRA